MKLDIIPTLLHTWRTLSVAIMHFRVALLFCVLQVANAFLFDRSLPRLTPDSIVHLNTSIGELLGRKSILSVDGATKQVTIFRGIPYAEAPIGNLRFEKPVPKAPFKTAFDATKFGPACLQIDYIANAQFSEDCLTLNVYVPSGAVPPSGQKAVMVWIHGGGFMVGAGSQYDAHRLSVNGDVIVVTVNYRLAQLGFLRINSSYIPGNYGLWDQHLALKWVHDNIGAFGGDVSKVTIFGESAGSASVMFQVTYPGNKGLFQRAIAESGSISSSWAKVDETRSKEATRQFAGSVGCNYVDDGMMMQCLRNVSADDILKSLNSAVYSPSAYSFTVAFDGDFVAAEQLDMFKMSSATSASLEFFNSLDLMIGVNRADGMVAVGVWPPLIGSNNTDPDTFSVTRQQFEDIIVPFFLSEANNYRNVSDAVKAAVLYTYTNWTDPDDMNSRLRNLVWFQTDIDFIVPTLTALEARNMSNGHSYLYEFALNPSIPLLAGMSRISDDEMANHADEIPFVFDSVNANSTVEEHQMAKAMRTFWTNFAKTGDPNQPGDVRQFYPITWPQYDQKSQKYLEFSPKMSPRSVKERLHARRIALWRNLIPALMQDNASTV